METNLLKRITVNSEVCHGKTTIRNTRHLVEGILEYLAGGDTAEDILNDFPELEKTTYLPVLHLLQNLSNSKILNFRQHEISD